MSVSFFYSALGGAIAAMPLLLIHCMCRVYQKFGGQMTIMRYIELYMGHSVLCAY